MFTLLLNTEGTGSGDNDGLKFALISRFFCLFVNSILKKFFFLQWPMYYYVLKLDFLTFLYMVKGEYGMSRSICSFHVIITDGMPYLTDNLILFHWF